ncbi:MAG: LLM class flavin-dependent oxidoreductase [Acidimicrobiales bacterium]
MPASLPPLGVTFTPPYSLGAASLLSVARRAEELGYRSFWTSEITGPETFSTLGAISVAAPSLDLASGVVALQLRTPPLLAMAAATLQALAPERDVMVGIGISSPVVAGRWHGATYGDRPLSQVREFVEVLRACLSGEPVDYKGAFYRVSRFRLGVAMGERRPRIVLGALNPGMLRLAGEVADGVLLSYLPPSHVPRSVEHVRAGGDAAVYAYVHCRLGDPEANRDEARKHLFGYLTVDAYATSFARAGYAATVREVRERYRSGDKEGALAAISDDLVDGIDRIGDAGHLRASLAAYAEAGVDFPIVSPLPWGPDRFEAVLATLEAAAGAG